VLWRACILKVGNERIGQEEVGKCHVWLAEGITSTGGSCLRALAKKGHQGVPGLVFCSEKNETVERK